MNFFSPKNRQIERRQNFTIFFCCQISSNWIWSNFHDFLYFLSKILYNWKFHDFFSLNIVQLNMNKLSRFFVISDFKLFLQKNRQIESRNCTFLEGRKQFFTFNFRKSSNWMLTNFHDFFFVKMNETNFLDFFCQKTTN